MQVEEIRNIAEEIKIPEMPSNEDVKKALATKVKIEVSLPEVLVVFLKFEALGVKSTVEEQLLYHLGRTIRADFGNYSNNELLFSDANLVELVCEKLGCVEV
ncbi:MAG: hypothetical protein PXY39_02100 [archaeon]|nr:hypothetical protein [archaeon]